MLSIHKYWLNKMFVESQKDVTKVWQVVFHVKLFIVFVFQANDIPFARYVPPKSNFDKVP